MVHGSVHDPKAKPLVLAVDRSDSSLTVDRGNVTSIRDSASELSPMDTSIDSVKEAFARFQDERKRTSGVPSLGLGSPPSTMPPTRADRSGRRATRQAVSPRSESPISRAKRKEREAAALSQSNRYRSPNRSIGAVSPVSAGSPNDDRNVSAIHHHDSVSSRMVGEKSQMGDTEQARFSDIRKLSPRTSAVQAAGNFLSQPDVVALEGHAATGDVQRFAGVKIDGNRVSVEVRPGRIGRFMAIEESEPNEIVFDYPLDALADWSVQDGAEQHESLEVTVNALMKDGDVQSRTLTLMTNQAIAIEKALSLCVSHDAEGERSKGEENHSKQEEAQAMPGDAVEDEQDEAPAEEEQAEQEDADGHDAEDEESDAVAPLQPKKSKKPDRSKRKYSVSLTSGALDDFLQEKPKRTLRPEHYWSACHRACLLGSCCMSVRQTAERSLSPFLKASVAVRTLKWTSVQVQLRWKSMNARCRS
jgi:hypothetical protein